MSLRFNVRVCVIAHRVLVVLADRILDEARAQCTAAWQLNLARYATTI